MTQAPDHSRPASPANRWILAVMAIALVLLLAYILRLVLVPFLIAGGLAYVSNPSIRWLQARLRLPRWAAAMGPLLVMLAVLAVIGIVVKVYVVPELTSLITEREEILERFLTTVFQGKSIPVGGGKTYTTHDAALAVLDNVGALVPRSEVIPTIGMACAVVMSGILTFVLYVYFLVDGPRLSRGMLWVVPPALRPRAEAVGRRAGPMIFSYVRGILIITAYAITFSWIALRCALHLPHAVVLALAVGLLELVPLVGPVLSIVIVCLVAVEQMTLWNIAGLAIFATALRVSIDQFVGPLVLSKAVRVPPPAVIFAFIAGGVVWGLMGVLVAIPLAAMVKMVLEEAYGEAGKLEIRNPNAEIRIKAG
jgi:predicted PurR-regulated permease PerM